MYRRRQLGYAHHAPPVSARLLSDGQRAGQGSSLVTLHPVGLPAVQVQVIEVLDTACDGFALVAREELPLLQERLLVDLREVPTLLPPRRLRFYSRVVKRAYSSFYCKRPGQQGCTLKRQTFRDILLSMALHPWMLY
jgi:hypothetical protein